MYVTSPPRRPYVCKLCLRVLEFRWYKRAEAQKRYSFFFSSTTLAGAFGGLLATVIGKMDGMQGYHGWRWVFILGMSSSLPHSKSLQRADYKCTEGLLTCVVGALFYFVICDFPEDAKWLTEEERRFVKARLQEDVGASQRHVPLTIKDIMKTIGDREFTFLQTGKLSQ